MDLSGDDPYFGVSMPAGTTPEAWHGSAKWNFGCLIKTAICRQFVQLLPFVLQTAYTNNSMDAFLYMQLQV